MQKLTGSAVVFTTPWFDVVAKTFDGGQAPYYMLRMLDYVTVFATTVENRILLVRQYRPVTENYTLELPSGHVDMGESPDKAAKRELLEETGYQAHEMKLLGTLIPDTGRLGNKLWCFSASGVTLASFPVVKEQGIELVTCSAGELMDYVSEAKFNHALHLAVVLLAVQQGQLTVGEKPHAT